MTDEFVGSQDRDVAFSGRFEGGQFIVGDHNAVHQYQGTVVQVMPSEALPKPRPSARPQSVLPRAGEPPLGRGQELGQARSRLRQDESIEFYGPAGIGKSALIRELAREEPERWPDGVVHARVARRPLEDVLQWLFETFFETDTPWEPGPLRVGRYLRELRALVILDDVTLDVAEAQQLLDAMPQASFLLGGAQAHLDDVASGIGLHGLSVPDGLALFERCLGRAAGVDERSGLASLVDELGGVPGLVVEASRAVRDQVWTVSELVAQPAAELDRRRVLALTEPQRQLLSLLAELAPAAVPVQLAVGPGQSADDLAALERAGLAQSSSPFYALAHPVSSPALPAADPVPALERLALAGDGGRLSEDAMTSAVTALEWGRRAGALDAVVETARAVDGALLSARRTGAWGVALECAADAAHACGRQFDEAYFLHQRGTRLLMLGELATAAVLLRQALDLRQRLDDQAGMAATSHNLKVLREASGVPGSRGGPGRGRGGAARRLGPWAFGALGVIVGVGAALAVGGSQPKTETVTRVDHATTVVHRPAKGHGRTVTGVTRTVVQKGTGKTETVTTTSTSTTTTTTTSTTTTTTTTTTTVTQPAGTAQ